MVKTRLHLGEDDDQGEEGEGLDQSQAQHQEGEDAGARPRIASQRFNGRANRLALTQTAKTGGQAHTETGADGNETDDGRAAIREGRNGEAKRRQGHEQILKFAHISPAFL